MARYKEDQREVYQFFTGSLDEMLPQASVARDIAAGLELLDFTPFEQLYKNDEAGSTAINPRSLAGVIILGMVRDITSSVLLAWLCGSDIEFRWMAGGVRIEKSTLCDFRKKHLDELTAVGCEVLEALGQNDLLPGENMGVDGRIVRAAASRHSRKKRKHVEKAHAQLEQLVRERLEADNADAAPGDTKTLEKRRKRLDRALEEMTRRGLTKDEDALTITEPEAGFKRQKDGAFGPGYNAQVVCDLDSGAIVSAQIVDAGNDAGQLKPQVEQAQGALADAKDGAADAGIASVTADGAYHDTRQLAELEGGGIRCYVPETRNANRKTPGVAEAYQADAFTHDEATDTMRCPQGQALARRKTNANDTATVYEGAAAICAACPARQDCCPETKGGRSVSRVHDRYRTVLDDVRARLNTEEGQRRHKARWTTGEGVFARLGGLLHWRRNRMWGMTGAQAELAWRVLAHNLFLLTGVWKPIILTNPGT